MFYRQHKRHIAPVGEFSMTKQSHQEECDINNIIRQYQRTGIYNHINSQSPQYEDLPDGLDYQESMNTILHAQSVFADLPAKVRDRFGNDPMVFLSAFQDEKQADYLREVGLLRTPKEEPAAPTAPIAKAATPASPPTQATSKEA